MSEHRSRAKAPFLTHVKRALGWNLGRVRPTESEHAALNEAGLVDPTLQRYAVWRRSLMGVAMIASGVPALFMLLDYVSDGFEESTSLGLFLESVWVAALVLLPVVCLLGFVRWRRPGSGARLLLAAYLATFVLPFLYALLPVGATAEVDPSVDRSELPASAGAPAEADDVAKLEDVAQMAVDFVMGAPGVFALLPLVVSLIPGAVNGCLRVKTLLPAGQLAGWLLVWAAPMFLLLWLVVLLLVDQFTQNALLVVGVLLWAGAPLAYSLQRRAFVESQIGPAEEKKIGRAKRVVGLTALAGIALLVVFATTEPVAGLVPLGTDPETAMSEHLAAIQERQAEGEEIGLDEIGAAYEESAEWAYVFDPTFGWMLLDVIAKLFVVIAVFADLVLRVSLGAWKNDRALRARPEAAQHDASAAAIDAAI